MEAELGAVDSQFGIVLMYIIGGIVFAVGGLTLSRLLRPNRPNPEKLTTYECGEDPVGNARIQLNNRFYVAALIFLIFDVEVIFLFPWATVYADKALIAQETAWGWFALIELVVFAAILLIGLAYVWAKGDLDWVRPEVIKPTSPAKIPGEAYQTFNQLQK